MDLDEVVALGIGLVALLAAWLPAQLRDRPLSLPMFLAGTGIVLFALPVGFHPDPVEHTIWFERATELGVIVSLMSAGLRLDRPLGRRAWGSTWRLLAIGMPITIAVLAAAGRLAGLSIAAALLVGASLAPTDPVLAADVQVGEPSTGDGDDPWAEDEVRFALTSEAGLNDGLAFPFVYAAIAIASEGWTGRVVARWLLVDVTARVAIAVLVGMATGWLLGRLIFGGAARGVDLASTASGFVAIAAMLTTYGITELLHGYGFLAVFVGALTIRRAERAHRYHQVLHDFVDGIEQLLIVGLLVLLGGAVMGGLLNALDLAGALVAATCVFVARPFAGAVALAGARVSANERRTIGFFGIRGIGSIYYVAYAANSVEIGDIDRVWAIVGSTVLLSIVVHGVAATPVMRRLDQRRTRRVARAARPAAREPA